MVELNLHNHIETECLITAESGQISLPGTMVTEEILREDLQLLNNECMVTNNFIEIYPYIRKPVVKAGEPDCLGSDGYCINLYVRSINLLNDKCDDTSAAVQHAILVWLYIKERQLPYSIVSLEVSYSSWSLSSIEFIILSQKEFEEVYEELPKKEMDINVYVRELGRLWMEKNLELD